MPVRCITFVFVRVMLRVVVVGLRFRILLLVLFRLRRLHQLIILLLSQAVRLFRWMRIRSVLVLLWLLIGILRIVLLVIVFRVVWIVLVSRVLSGGVLSFVSVSGL